MNLLPLLIPLYGPLQLFKRFFKYLSNQVWCKYSSAILLYWL